MKNNYMIAEQAFEKAKKILDRIETTNMKEEAKQPSLDAMAKEYEASNKSSVVNEAVENNYSRNTEPRIIQLGNIPLNINEDDYLKVFIGQQTHINIVVKKCEQLKGQITDLNSVLLNVEKTNRQLFEQLDSCRDTVKRQSEMLQKEAHLKDISYGAGIRYKQEVEKLHRTIRGLKSVISGRKNGNRPPKK